MPADRRTQSPLRRHTRARAWRRREHLITDYLNDTTRCPICEDKLSRKSDLGRHMVSEHSLNVEEMMFTCRYCGEKILELSNLHRYEDLHFGQKPFVCGEQVTLKSDPSTTMICDLAFPTRSDLKRHTDCHEKRNFVVTSANSVKRQPQKVRQFNPEDRLPKATLDDKPAVCPKFKIEAKHLKEPLPSCFLPLAEDPDVPTSTTEAGPSTAPFQPSPAVYSGRYNPSPPPTPLASTPTNFNGVPTFNHPDASSDIPSTSGVSHHDFTAAHPFSPDGGPILTAPEPSLPAHWQPPAAAYIPQVATEETILNGSLQETQFFTTAATTNQIFTGMNSYNSNLNPSLPYQPSASDPTQASTPEELDFNASLPNAQYQATTPSYPIYNSNLDPDLIRQIDEPLTAHPFPPQHDSWYQTMALSEFSEEVDLHIMQPVQQYNQQYGQQYGPQYGQQHEQYHSLPSSSLSYSSSFTFPSTSSSWLPLHHRHLH